MKKQKTLQRWFTATAVALALAGATGSGHAQNTNPTNTFDIAASTTSFVVYWGTATMVWDATRDAASDAASGSVRYTAPFVGASGEQFMTFFTIANRWGWDFGTVIDATTYTNLSFDLKVDSSSGQRVNANDFGWLEIGLMVGTSGGSTPLPGRAIPLSATSWTHFDYPLSPTLDNIDKVSGFFIKMWSNGNHTNSLVFNVDNFMITKPTAPVVIPPPTVSLQPTKSKLNLLASGTGQYDRQQVRTVANDFSWVGSSEPVTYEFTLKDSPGTNRLGFQAHMFLVPNSTDTAASIDWNVPNLVWLHIENLENGGGQATFRYKTNRPQGNDMLFNANPDATNSSGGLITVGNLGTVQAPDILGTWKLIMSNDTNATLVASDGSTLNVSIPVEAAPLFSGTMQVFVGAQPNNVTYVGSGYVVDKVKVSKPSQTLIEDDFSSGVLDTNKWAKQASDPAGVFVVPTTSPKALHWTLPATSFTPQVGTNIIAGSTWKAPLSSEYIKIGDSRRVLLSNSELDPNTAYFRLIKREFTKLQILLPGETAAPGTPTGKTGTPTAQTVEQQFNVTVRAVDADWYPVPGSSHTISLTTTGDMIYSGATAMNNGEATFQVAFFGAGSFTITATDDTDNTKTADTSTAVTVN